MMGEARSRVQASLTTFIQSRLPNRCARRTLLYHANACCRRALTHGAIDSGHGYVITCSGEAQGRLQTPFQIFIPSSQPNRFAYRTLIRRTDYVLCAILTPSLSCNTWSPTCLHVASLDVLCKRINRQASYFGCMRTLVYVNLGCVERCLSTALATTHLTLASLMSGCFTK